MINHFNTIKLPSKRQNTSSLNQHKLFSAMSGRESQQKERRRERCSSVDRHQPLDEELRRQRRRTSSSSSSASSSLPPYLQRLVDDEEHHRIMYEDSWIRVRPEEKLAERPHAVVAEQGTAAVTATEEGSEQGHRQSGHGDLRKAGPEQKFHPWHRLNLRGVVFW